MLEKVLETRLDWVPRRLTSNSEKGKKSPEIIRFQDFRIGRVEQKRYHLPMKKTGPPPEPSVSGSGGERRSPGVQSKKSQPPKATGFSEPCGGCSDDGPSDWFRTSGLVVPNHALYHLSYTRIFSFLRLFAVVVKPVIKRRFSGILRERGKCGKPSVSRGCGISDYPGWWRVLHAPKPSAIPNFAKPGAAAWSRLWLIIYDAFRNCNRFFRPMRIIFLF